MHMASSRPFALLPAVMFEQKPPISPLMLADRLLSLAEDADRAGNLSAATTLLQLAHTVLDERSMQ